MEIVVLGIIQLSAASLLVFLLWFVVLPLILQTMLNGLINLAESILKVNLRQFISLICFPGSLLRMAFLYLAMKLVGWESNMNHGNMGSKNSKGRGMMTRMRPPKKLKLGDVLFVTMATQFTWLVALFIAVNYGAVVRILATVVGASASTWYVVLLLSLIFGGMPVPEESMLLLEYLLSNYSHFLAGFSILAVASALISSVHGGRAGIGWFIIFGAVILLKSRLLREDKETDAVQNTEEMVIA